jgi:hypothetical protein
MRNFKIHSKSQDVKHTHSMDRELRGYEEPSKLGATAESNSGRERVYFRFHVSSLLSRPFAESRMSTQARPCGLACVRLIRFVGDYPRTPGGL